MTQDRNSLSGKELALVILNPLDVLMTSLFASVIIYAILYPSPMAIKIFSIAGEISIIATALYLSPYLLMLLLLDETKKEGRDFTLGDVGFVFLISAPFMAIAITALLIKMNPILRFILVIYGAGGELPTLELIEYIYDSVSSS
jgi:hypothetical protein